MRVYPNVKVNLGLSVLRRRPDGYHDIETLFLPYFGITDEIELFASPDFRFEPSPNVSWTDDLTVRAYELLKSDFDLPPVTIRLNKLAPVGAGLGSGSSDAAFTLRALNELFGLGLTDAQLAAYAARLGSDCAFFIYNRPMFGEGRGEILTPYELDLSGLEIRVAFPSGVSVSTKEAYSNVIRREESSERLLPLREVLQRPMGEWKDLLLNDFERSVFPLHPEIEALKKEFYAQGAIYASMSGSGSAVFGIFAK